MTICNMSIEGGARAGMVAPDATTFAYVKDRPKAPKGAAFDKARAYWESLVTDDGAYFDREVRLDAANLPPIVSWGTSPEDVISIQGLVPDPAKIADENVRQTKEKALAYMGLTPGTKITDITLDRCSSAPAPTDGSRTCAKSPGSSATARSTRASRR